ncbi:neutral zinc metallopeptidase [Actinacidiphila guanduensis]|uniref:Uncharacterized protein n=1 Tax=Actinacidiphila guanduensis TaxID=310781 RepID=A0A1H0B292_9ACTN|nr:neutral zinc metallopeptidase [Actinacidiphila guanduensis]SDN39760.1 hypothetical protein SAMN05216259_10420 [Actinacidiphila guanduensis]
MTQADIGLGPDAAAPIGDDRIQRKYQGKVNPDTRTRGPAARRRQWFTMGYRSGGVAARGTFA